MEERLYRCYHITVDWSVFNRPQTFIIYHSIYLHPKFLDVNRAQEFILMRMNIELLKYCFGQRRISEKIIYYADAKELSFPALCVGVIDVSNSSEGVMAVKTIYKQVKYGIYYKFRYLMHVNITRCMREGEKTVNTWGDL